MKPPCWDNAVDEVVPQRPRRQTAAFHGVARSEAVLVQARGAGENVLTCAGVDTPSATITDDGTAAMSHETEVDTTKAGREVAETAALLLLWRRASALCCFSARTPAAASR
jgi:hypothetical protein